MLLFHAIEVLEIFSLYSRWKILTLGINACFGASVPSFIDACSSYLFCEHFQCWLTQRDLKIWQVEASWSKRANQINVDYPKLATSGRQLLQTVATQSLQAGKEQVEIFKQTPTRILNNSRILWKSSEQQGRCIGTSYTRPDNRIQLTIYTHVWRYNSWHNLYMDGTKLMNR